MKRSGREREASDGRSYDRGSWTKGYTEAELDTAQHRFGLIFPPDLVALLRKRPVEGHDWTDDAAIKQALDWPFNGLLTSVESGQLWWPEWGTRPSSAHAREQVLRYDVSCAPKLIPLIGHRYLPEEPRELGNAVSSPSSTSMQSTTVPICRTISNESSKAGMAGLGQVKSSTFPFGPTWWSGSRRTATAPHEGRLWAKARHSISK